MHTAKTDYVREVPASSTPNAPFYPPDLSVYRVFSSTPLKCDVARFPLTWVQALAENNFKADNKV